MKASAIVFIILTAEPEGKVKPTDQPARNRRRDWRLGLRLSLGFACGIDRVVGRKRA